MKFKKTGLLVQNRNYETFDYGVDFLENIFQKVLCALMVFYKFLLNY